MKLRFMLSYVLILSVCASRKLPAQQTPAPLEIPGFTAYSEPNPEALEISETNPIKGWLDAKTTLTWYGLLRTTGKLHVSVRLHLPAGDHSKFHMEVDDHPLSTKTVEGTNDIVTVSFGFARGYFGIQVNSPTERRIIFSVWDSGKEPTDRSKVAPENRVQLLAKGPGVFASDFGNEGTGGHSHLVYPWKTGDTYRFLVSAQQDGESTIYTGYFYFPEKQAWGLIASFRAPKDGKYLSHLYSFNEDFDGANGQQKRLAQFGNQWIKTTDDRWVELTKARFTHTARGLYKDRLDRGAGVVGNRFYLTNGGFNPESIEYDDEINRPATNQPPDVALPK